MILLFKMSEIIKLNFRGEIIYVLKDTINIKDSYFNLIFSNKEFKNEDIFLDRDIIYFKQILNYLIYDEIYITKENYKYILQDFKFYNFNFDDKIFSHISEYNTTKNKIFYDDLYYKFSNDKVKLFIAEYKIKIEHNLSEMDYFNSIVNNTMPNNCVVKHGKNIYCDHDIDFNIFHEIRCIDFDYLNVHYKHLNVDGIIFGMVKRYFNKNIDEDIFKVYKNKLMIGCHCKDGFYKINKSYENHDINFINIKLYC